MNSQAESVIARRKALAQALEIAAASKPTSGYADDFDAYDTGEIVGLKRLKLYDMEVLVKSISGLKEEAREFAKKMQRSGSWRTLTPVPDNYQKICEALAEEFPNFSGYIDEYLLPSLSIGHLCDSCFILPPTVFVGPPGLGKTLFVSKLSKVFGLDFERLNLETAQASFEVIGTATGWSNSTPGLIYRWLSSAKSANGILVMEELDKCSPDSRYSVLNVLIQLLEPTTSVAVADKSHPDLKLDLSQISYLFTANSLLGISAPILSRLLVVDIPELTPAQAKRVALNQYEALIDSLNLPITAPRLTEHGLAVLSEESPRRQRLLMQMALGRAIAEKSDELTITSTQKPSGPKMGFF
jgi:ATP-dependent Lon protease